MSATWADYSRRVERVIEIAPSPAEWDEYERAKEAWAILEDSPYFYAADADLIEPRPKREVVYAETEEEWRERISHLPKYVTIPVIGAGKVRHAGR